MMVEGRGGPGAGRGTLLAIGVSQERRPPPAGVSMEGPLAKTHCLPFVPCLTGLAWRPGSGCSCPLTPDLSSGTLVFIVNNAPSCSAQACATPSK